MKLIDQPGGSIWVTDAPDWNSSDPHATHRIAVTPESLHARAERGLRHVLGQMYGVMCPGLIMAEHVFQGLKRGMSVGDDHDAAANKLAITWAAQRDATLTGDKFNPTLSFVDAPPNRVFVVYVSPNEMLKEFPSVFGWGERWTWVAADPDLPGAPIDSETRYDSRLWSRHA
ncbi:hypothetical protein [Pelagibius sp.]|uniref:hypothetical protein n=1 Tax=Pelagibius sp. TaxID=1931238 RepID=UPI002607BBE7|nr:hypothetical protein [Pelagibius sp.]